MEVRISGRHVDVTDVMQGHIRNRIDRLPRFDDQIQAVTVTLMRDARGDRVEVIAKCHRSTLVANARSHDMYQSIEEAFEKVERQIARLHDKIVSKHKAQQAARMNRERSG